MTSTGDAAGVERSVAMTDGIMGNQRIPFFDNAKAVMLFLVIFGHFLDFYIKDSFLPRVLYYILYSFHMPIFTFLSGLLASGRSHSLGALGRRLLLPYFIFNILWSYFMWFYDGTKFLYLVTPGFALWYLLSLFCWRLVAPAFSRLPYAIPASLALALAAGFVEGIDQRFALSRTICYFPFFLAGYRYPGAILEFARRLGRRPVALLHAGLALALAVWLYQLPGFTLSTLWFSQPYTASGGEALTGLTDRALAYLLCAIVSVLVLGQIPTRRRWYGLYGERSLQPYLLHSYGVFCCYLIFPGWRDFLVPVYLASSLAILHVTSLDWLSYGKNGLNRLVAVVVRFRRPPV